MGPFPCAVWSLLMPQQLLHAIPSWCSTCSRGFGEAFLNIRSDLEEEVSQAISNGVDRVVCLGHSLGGALATLTAAWLRTMWNRAPQQVWCITFGSPRVSQRQNSCLVR